MTDMTGPSDEIDFVGESGVNEAEVGEYIIAQREDGRLIFGKVVEIVPQDTPVEGQSHLRPPDVKVPVGTVENGRMYRGLSPDGQPVWIRYEPEADPRLADMIPRRKQRRHIDEMLQEDARREAEQKAEAERQARLSASASIADQLEVYMERLIYGKGRYRDYSEAGALLADVLAALRGEIVWRPELDIRAALCEAWDSGYTEGAAYVSGCCGCSGRGPLPTNPYRGR